MHKGECAGAVLPDLLCVAATRSSRRGRALLILMLLLGPLLLLLLLLPTEPVAAYTAVIFAAQYRTDVRSMSMTEATSTSSPAQPTEAARVAVSDTPQGRSIGMFSFGSNNERQLRARVKNPQLR